MAKGCGIGHKNTNHVDKNSKHTDKYMSKNII
jgi:hypothetical protein